jgi:hypothetical protein
MSADNAIVIGKFLVNGKVAFSVVETSAIDNVDYYRNRGNSRELQEYVHDIWKRGKFFLDEKEALTYAHTTNNECGTEYGVISIDFSDISPMPSLVSFVDAAKFAENYESKDMRKTQPEIKLDKEWVAETLGIFKGLLAACPMTESKEFELWMMHQIHKMWQDKKISGNQVALLLDEVCCY